jgi:AcrR family transcriptional regulator
VIYPEPSEPQPTEVPDTPLPSGGHDPPLPSGRHNIPREVVVRSQRSRILQATAETCVARGYAAATVGEITERAGVSSVTFYELFRDKDGAVAAAGNAMLAEIITVASAAYGPEKSYIELVHDCVVGLLELLAAQPSFAKLAFLEGRATPRTREIFATGERALTSLIETGWAYAPDDSPRPAKAARAAVGAVEALLRRELAAGRTDQLPERLPEILYALLVPFIGQDEALRQLRLARDELTGAG